MTMPISHKKEFREEIVPEYHKLLQENTVSLAIIDYQLQITAFSLKKYLELLEQQTDEDGSLRRQVFKDTASVVSDFFPMVSGPVLNDPETWMKQLAVEPYLTGRRFLREYYAQLESGKPIDTNGLRTRYNLA